MNYIRGMIAATVLTLAGAASAAPAAPATKTLPSATPALKTLPAAGTRVNITVSCVPDAATLAVSGCRVDKVEPPEFTPVVSDNAVKAAQASKLPADWRSTVKIESGRVLLPVTVMARPAAPRPPVAAAPQPGDVVITLSCLPQADFTVKDCRFVKAEPSDMASLQTIALSSVAQGRLAADWQARYQIQDGRVLLPVRLSKRPGQ